MSEGALMSQETYLECLPGWTQRQNTEGYGPDSRCSKYPKRLSRETATSLQILRCECCTRCGDAKAPTVLVEAAFPIQNLHRPCVVRTRCAVKVAILDISAG